MCYADFVTESSFGFIQVIVGVLVFVPVDYDIKFENTHPVAVIQRR